MNFLESFRLIKSVRATDEFYLDESGKHVIFRNIGGKVRPIKVTAEEYAEWLNEQGIQVDPADQAQLNKIEEELEVLEQAAEVSPQLQKQYEDAFNQQRMNYFQYANKYYQQALQQQSAQHNLPPETIQAQRKKVYEESKADSIDRKDLPDRGWESYIESYMEKVSKDNGFSTGDGQWFVLQALDTVFVRAVELAKKGESPSTVRIEDVLKKEIEEGYPTLRKLLDTRYAKYKTPGKEYIFDSKIMTGMRDLVKNLSQNPEIRQTVNEMFDEKYALMYQDFAKSQGKFTKMTLKPDVGVDRKSIPENLPEKFTSDEAASLLGVYKAYKNSPTAGANRVALHALARLYEAIPEKDRAMVAAELSDGAKGIHSVHRAGYTSAYQRKVVLGMSVDVDQEVEEMLRVAAVSAQGTTQQKVAAMKEIAMRLGAIDGLNAFALLNEENPSARAFQAKWKDSSLNAGRQKGEGPDLIGNIIDDDARAKATYKNRTLKLMHKPTKAPKDNIEVPESIKKPEEKSTKTESDILDGSNLGFTRNKGVFTYGDGYVVKPGMGTWKVYSPDGAEIGNVFVEPTNKENVKAVLKKALLGARAVIEGHQPKAPEEASKIGLLGFKDSIKGKDLETLGKIEEFVAAKGLEVRSLVPGTVYEIGGKVKLLRAKNTGNLLMVVPGQQPVPAHESLFVGLFSEGQKSVNFVPGLSFSQKPR